MTNLQTENCLTCRSVARIERISPGPVIYDGNYWIVDHAYPTSHPGWLVIVLKRHAEALHELSREEFQDLGELQYRVVQALAREFACAKEYIMMFAEQAGFSHLHFHVIQRPEGLQADYRGTKIFGRLNVALEEALPAEEIIKVSEQISQRMNSF